MSKDKTANRPLPRWVENICIAGVVIISCITVLTSYFVYANSIDWTVLRIIKYLIVMLMFLKIVVFDLNFYSRRMIVGLLIIMICFAISAFVSDNRILLQSYIVIVAMFRVNYKRLLMYFLIIEGGLFLLIMLLAAFGVIPDLVFGRGGELYASRHSLGFRWCATPAIFGWSLSMVFLYCCGKDVEWWELGAVLLVNLALFIITDTRLELLCTVVGVAAAIVNKYQKKCLTDAVKKTMRMLVLLLPLVLMVGSFVLAYGYDSSNGIMRRLDSWSSSRLRLSNMAVYKYDLTLFGNKTEWMGLADIYEGKAEEEDFGTVDNSYVLVFLRFGVVVGITILGAYFVLGKWAIVQKDYLLEMILIIIIIHSLFNPHIATIPHNAFLLMNMPATMFFVDHPKELMHCEKK